MMPITNMSMLFIQIRFLDVIDILLVAVLLYQLFALIRGTGAMHIFFGILLIYLIWWLVRLFEMQLLSAILGQFISVGVLALIIVFQPEIRKFLIMLGARSILNKGTRKVFRKLWQFDPKEKLNISSVVNACENLAGKRTGALIVIAVENELDYYQETGQLVNAQVSEQLLETIFFKNSPLHDGAVIISGNLIKSARCVLPVSDKETFPDSFGLRHRAAAGITEHSDAVAIVVSEQTGMISLAREGEITRDIRPVQLKEFLVKMFAG